MRRHTITPREKKFARQPACRAEPLEARRLMAAHWYALTPSASSWSDAEATATASGGHLVAINDWAEQQFVVQTFLTDANRWNTLWIGLTDRQQ